MTLSNSDIAKFLRNIPQSNQDKKSIKNICTWEANPLDRAALLGVVKMLQIFGVVCIESDVSPSDCLIQASSQTAKYTLMSLSDYIECNQPIINDWHTRGLKDNIFDNGATFLHALEQLRYSQIEDATPSRYVKVAQVLIKRINPVTQEHELLFQFDKNANQYQLIGGRWSEKDGDNLQTTMIREIEEELPRNHLPYPQAYQLENIIENLTIDGTISPTFGALTQYTFSIYHMQGLKQPLKLLPEDQWIPITMILDEVIRVNGVSYPFTSPEIYRRIEESLPQGMLGLSSSYNR